MVKNAKNVCVSLMQLPRQGCGIMEKQLLNRPWNLDFKPEKRNAVKEGTKTQKNGCDFAFE